jgi:hypothetical protein
VIWKRNQFSGTPEVKVEILLIAIQYYRWGAKHLALHAARCQQRCTLWRLLSQAIQALLITNR